MSQSERLHQIVQWLRAGQRLSMPRIAERLGVSHATVKRDIAYLRDRVGVPIVRADDGRGLRLGNAGTHDGADAPAELPGLWFSAHEAHALLTMQRLLADLDTGGLLGPHIAPLRVRLARLLDRGGPPEAEIARRVRLLTMGARRVHLPHFQAIGSALLQRRRMRIDYRSRTRDERHEREVSAQRLVHYRDNWYLDAWCHWRDALRSFAVDAIDSVRTLDAPALDVDDDELDASLGAGYGIFAGRAVHEATLRFSAQRARWVAAERWHPHQLGRWDAEGRWLLSVPYADPRELVMDILRHVPEVEVIGPPELEDEVRRRLLEGLRRLDGLDE